MRSSGLRLPLVRGPTGNLKTMIEFGPKLRSTAVMEASKPVRIAPTPMMVPVPMITPSTVRNARSLCVRMVCNASDHAVEECQPVIVISPPAALRSGRASPPAAPDRCRRTAPPTAESPTPRNTDVHGSAMGTEVTLRTSTATHHATHDAHQAAQRRPAPPIPPGTDSGCRARRAPSDLRMPISCVRSVTTASMMFMITMPPTTMKTETMPTAMPAMVEVSRSHRLTMVSEAKMLKVVVLPGPQMAVGAQQHARFVLRFHQVLLVDGFGDQADSVVRAVGLEVALDGNHHEVVLRVAEHAAQRLGDADHFVRIAFNLDGLADRVAVREEARANIVADEGHRRVAADLFVGDAAAGIHLNIVDGGNVVGDAFDIHAFRGVALVGDARLARDHHAEVFQQRGLAFDELVFVAAGSRGLRFCIS